MSRESYHRSNASLRRRRMSLFLIQSSQPVSAAGDSPEEPPAPDSQQLPTELASLEPLLSLAVPPELIETPPVPAFRKVVVFTGDSLLPTGQLPGEEQDHFAYALGLALLRNARKEKFETHFSDSSGLLLQHLADQFFHRVECFHPDLVILTFGYHELKQQGESLLAFERTFHACMDRIQQAGAAVIVNLPPATVAAGEEIDPDRLIRLEALRACSREAGVTCVDHWRHWEDFARADWNRVDGPYPSRKGIEKMVQLFLKETQSELLHSITTVDSCDQAAPLPDSLEAHRV